MRQAADQTGCEGPSMGLKREQEEKDGEAHEAKLGRARFYSLTFSKFNFNCEFALRGAKLRSLKQAAGRHPRQASGP